LKQKGENVSLPALLEEIRERDARDSQRSVAPLKPADDAVELDSTHLSIQQVLERILTLAAERDLAG
jgi:CMP/dCMP kinase